MGKYNSITPEQLSKKDSVIYHKLQCLARELGHQRKIYPKSNWTSVAHIGTRGAFTSWKRLLSVWRVFFSPVLSLTFLPKQTGKKWY